MSKTVSFQTFQFSISTQFNSIWPIDRTLSGAITPDERGPGDSDNEGVLRIPQSPSITGTSPSDCLVPYPGHSLERRSYPSTYVQSENSTALADWARYIMGVKYSLQIIILNLIKKNYMSLTFNNGYLTNHM